ncbi:MAG: hypothetical protein FD170_2713 [Bacteroidetes bacterium]|nr:MAG: hypothetical protein FD170_2713 [Bacteroidota bacterium]
MPQNYFMVRHIVFLKYQGLLNQADQDEVVREVKSQLELLPAIIPGIDFFEVHHVLPIDGSSPDLVIVSEFADMDALKAYLFHPAHLAFVEWNKDKCPKIAAADSLI